MGVSTQSSFVRSCQPFARANRSRLPFDGRQLLARFPQTGKHVARRVADATAKPSGTRRATEGTTLATAFDGLQGTSAVVWGGEDIVTLAKEVTRLADDEKFSPFAPKGGVMDGAKLSADEVVAVSKWPSRTEQLSILAGQILGPGAKLSAQLLGPGGGLASQVEGVGQNDQ